MEVDEMKESVAIAKEVNRRQGSSPNKSDNNIQRLRNGHKRQIGSLRSVVGNIRRNSDTPSVESVATELSVMPSTDRASALLALQQTHGNRYVQRVVTGIQAKLKIGQPGDIYEQEADRVAEQVMRMPEPPVQRQVEPEEEEEEESLQTKPLAEQITPLVQRQVEEEEEEEPIMAKSMNGGAQRVKDDLHIRLNQSRDGGQPLQETGKNFMERRFGVDFSGVRVHTDSNAAQLSRDLNAQAFTHGRNIHFGAGKYNPESSQGKKLLAHELTHVVQQTGGAPISQDNGRSGQTPPGGRHALTSRLNATSMQRTAESRARTTTTTLPGISWQAISAQPMIQRDLAIRPPRPDATGRTLSASKMKEAIDYNKKYLSNIPNSTGVIRMIRDVLGISPTTAVDEDFVNAVLGWQAMYRLTQDGKLGPSSARRLFRELGAEKEGQGKVKSGPRYSPQVPTVSAGRTSFRFNAEFESDPAKGIFPSCCEVRQFIRWNAAAATSFAAIRGAGNTVPHAGFPAAHRANRWIEDRDSGNNRYGHRSGPFSDPQSYDQYLDSSGKRNQAYGHIYRGRDSPNGPATIAGQWRFLVKVIDVCRGGRTIGGQDVIRINW
ncbi:MAG: eCIS core domain-containing protein [Candidatus Methanospirareceae archaeon]